MAGWGCPHEDHGHCRRMGRDCDPGMQGCVLHGRVVFAERPDKDPTPEDVERAKRRVAKRRGGRDHRGDSES